jgi:pimeloyl-ACP methyl ester carboxylesterase
MAMRAFREAPFAGLPDGLSWVKLRQRRRRMRLCAVLAGLVLSAVSADAAPSPPPGPASVPAAVSDSFYMRAGTLVAVDGSRRLNLSCMGEGSPTVLFDSGMGDSSLVWRLVQGEVAKLTRACAYDRAGIGFSDPRRGASDARAAVADLHALLLAAKIKTPVLYVGHSLAGLFGVLLQASHPGDLAGAVLVEPSFANQWDALSGAGIAAGAPQKAADDLLAALHAQVARLKECATLPEPLPKDCAGMDSRLPPGLAAFKKTQISRPSYLLTKASEFESFLSTKTDKNLDQKELEAVKVDFDHKPLIVLTRGNEVGNPGFTAEQSAAMNKAWNVGHDRLAALSTRGSNTVVPDSSHYIQLDQPQAVIDAVKRAVTDIRGR